MTKRKPPKVNLFINKPVEVCPKCDGSGSLPSLDSEDPTPDTCYFCAIRGVHGVVSAQQAAEGRLDIIIQHQILQKERDFLRDASLDMAD